MRQSTLYNGFVQDLAAFQQQVNPPEEEVNVIVVDNSIAKELMIASADPAYRKKMGHIIAALDVETTTSKPPTGRSRTVRRTTSHVGASTTP